MRLFLALPAPGPPDAYAEATRRLAAAAPGARPVPAGTWHATLRFLGDRADPDEVARAVAPAVAGLAPFAVEARGVGAFPSPRKARVAWAGLHGNGLDALAAAVRAATPQMEDADGKPFHAHVTLARLDPPRDLQAFVAANQDLPFGAGRVDEVVLSRSDLGPGGPAYTRLAAFPLAGR